jgi:hypothetical protein
MIEKDERTFNYVKLRVLQNFERTWFTVYQHACNFIVPVLLGICFMQRAITFQLNKKEDYDFDFTSTIEKHKQAIKDQQTYDIFGDREQLQAVVTEVTQKGLLPPEYQLMVINFVILWYFFASFLV